MPRVLRAAIAVLALLLGAVVAAPAASAHTPTIRTTCEGLSVKLTQYVKGPNTVKIVVGGDTVVEERFNTSFQKTVPFEFGSKESLTWSVTVTAHDDPRGQKGWSFTKKGTEKNCAPAPSPSPYPNPNPYPTPVPAPSVEVLCAEGGVVVTLPEAPGVGWQINGEDVDAEEGAVLVPVAEDTEYSINVDAVSTTDGKELDGQTSWSFAGVLDCAAPQPQPEPQPEPEPVTPVAPTAEVDCAEEGVVVTLPEVDGLGWVVDGEATEAGTVTVPVAEGETYTVVVEAEAAEGRVIQGTDRFELSGTRVCDDVTPTPVPSTEAPAPTPTTDAVVERPDTDQLPRTGSNLLWFAAAGALLLGGGAALLLTLRSRRTESTPAA